MHGAIAWQIRNRHLDPPFRVYSVCDRRSNPLEWLKRRHSTDPGIRSTLNFPEIMKAALVLAAPVPRLQCNLSSFSFRVSGALGMLARCEEVA